MDNKSNVKKRIFTYEIFFLTVSSLLIAISIFLSAKVLLDLGYGSGNNQLIWWSSLFITIIYLYMFEIALFIFLFGYIREVYTQVPTIKFIIYSATINIVFIFLSCLFVYYTYLSDVGFRYTEHLYISIGILIFNYLLLGLALKAIITKQPNEGND